eukprot:13933085-Alexandrium_andersonii.AAC.1
MPAVQFDFAFPKFFARDYITILTGIRRRRYRTVHCWTFPGKTLAGLATSVAKNFLRTSHQKHDIIPMRWVHFQKTPVLARCRLVAKGFKERIPDKDL